MNKLVNQILKFGLVGGIAFLIDFCIFAILVKIGIHYLIAQIISFFISLIFNYIASIKWVFNAKKQTKKEALLFLFLAIIGLGINELLLYIGISILNIDTLLTKLISTMLVMIYNFITRKLIIEKK
ncbi:MAG: GtrA family protein [Mollicutes bacterium]|nr:GtrA family protein [Mollicutes bacterium]